MSIESSYNHISHEQNACEKTTEPGQSEVTVEIVQSKAKASIEAAGKVENIQLCRR